MNNYEIERKFLIHYPPVSVMEDLGAEKIEMVQTYLAAEKGTTARVRKSITKDGTIYIRTSKQRINDIKCIEIEKEVTEEEYNTLLKTADANRTPIIKTRYKLPFDKHIFEIDIYPFWQDKAIMEVELQTEDETFDIPPVVQIIKEVTDDVRYKNFALATGNIPE